MKNRRPLMALVSSVAVAALALAGCSKSSGNKTENKTESGAAIPENKTESDAAIQCRQSADWMSSKLSNCLAACGEGLKWACEAADILKAKTSPKNESAQLTGKWANFKLQGTWKYKASKEHPKLNPLTKKPIPEAEYARARLTFGENGMVKGVCADGVNRCLGGECLGFSWLESSTGQEYGVTYALSSQGSQGVLELNVRNQDNRKQSVPVDYVSDKEFKVSASGGAAPLPGAPVQECIFVKDE